MGGGYSVQSYTGWMLVRRHGKPVGPDRFLWVEKYMCMHLGSGNTMSTNVYHWGKITDICKLEESRAVGHYTRAAPGLLPRRAASLCDPTVGDAPGGHPACI